MNTKKPRGIRKPKGYARGQTFKNFYIASCGDMPGDTVKFFDDWKMFLSLRPQMGEYNKSLMTYCGLSKKQVDKFPLELAADTGNHLVWAIENKDGSFFRELAQLCENPPQEDNLRSWLIAMHWDFKTGLRNEKQVQFYTCRQLCDLAVQRGIVKEISDRYMHQVCKELGVKFRPDRRGRKRNSEKFNLIH